MASKAPQHFDEQRCSGMGGLCAVLSIRYALSFFDPYPASEHLILEAKSQAAKSLQGTPGAMLSLLECFSCITSSRLLKRGCFRTKGLRTSVSMRIEA